MKITLYSIKGSAGKTPIAVNIALDKGWALGTNEPVNLLDHILPEEEFMTLDPEERFPVLPDDFPVIFDLAGHISKGARPSIVSAIEQSSVVLIPIYNELKCLHAGIATIREVEAINKNIVIIATKLQKKKGRVFDNWNDSEDCKNIQAIVNEAVGNKYPVLPLKYSTAFDAIFEQEKSIREIRKTSPLLRHAYKDVSDQFDYIFSYLEQNYAI